MGTGFRFLWKEPRFLRENFTLFDTRIDIHLKPFCFYRKHGSPFVKPVSLARELQFAHAKKWKLFFLCAWIQSNEEQGTAPKGRTCLGIYQDIYLLFLTAGVLFSGPLHFLQVENNPCSRIITRYTQKKKNVSLHKLEQASTPFWCFCRNSFGSYIHAIRNLSMAVELLFFFFQF